MIPIAKSINVIDENGNSLEPTYLKRAKGLVKNGRARWIGDKSICINTTIKSELMEVKNMDKQVFEYIKEQIEYLKLDLVKDVPLNMDSDFQPQAAADIYRIKDETKQKIINLLNRLLDIETGVNQDAVK